MDNIFDLDIKNYSQKDLENFFNLNNNYNEEEIEIKEKQIRNKILSNYEEDEYISTEIIDFLKKAKNVLKKLLNIDFNTYSKVEGGVHDIQIKQITPVMNSYNYLYPTGKVNPIERQVITKIICIDSLFRSNYKNTSATNFVWELPVPQQNVIEMKIVAVELPNFWYAFSNSKRNNTFSIKLFNIVGQEDITIPITIPEGNYISSELVFAMNNLFLSIGNGLQYLVFEINNNNAKTVIRARNLTDTPSMSLYISSESNYSPDFYFMIDFSMSNPFTNDIHKTVGWLLGFRKLTYTIKNTVDYSYLDQISTTNSILYNYYLISESTYGNSLNNYIFVVIDDFNKNFITDAITSTKNFESYIGNNILGRITINSNSNAINENYASDGIFKTRQYLGPIHLKKLQVSLIDKFGEYLEINDTNFSFALELSILY
jgi:hypothetical protein